MPGAVEAVLKRDRAIMAAGVYQFASLKHSCLGRCRSPSAFLAERWRAGRFGAFLMGLEHGAYCAVCCWALMTLLFAVGAVAMIGTGALLLWG